MKIITTALALGLLFVGCGGSVPIPNETFSFNPDIQVISSGRFQLRENVTSTKPWKHSTNVPAIAMFSQEQVWHTPSTTTIEVNYPYLQENTPAALAFNNYVHDLVAEEVASFLEASPDTINEEWKDVDYDLSIQGDVLAITPTFISVDFAITPYFSGAAHPGLYYRTVNFDLSSAADLGPTEIFSNPTLDLAVFQSLVVPRLVTFLNDSVDDIGAPFTADDEWILTGTAPSSTNYANIALTKEGLRAQFDPYQVAAYAFGAPDVTIPYSEIADRLQPGLLEHLGLN